MGIIRGFFAQYIRYVYLALREPGLVPFASVFGIAFADAVIPIPGGMDGLIATAVLATGGKAAGIAGYVLCAAFGNAIGNIIVYAIGYKGGQLFLEKRLGKERFARMHARFEKREFSTLMLAAIMPPPFPFKTVVLSAAAFEVDLSRFLLGILLGRVVRFAILSVLVLRFGPQAVEMVNNLVRRHLLATVLVAAGAILAGILVWRWKKQRKAAA